MLETNKWCHLTHNMTQITEYLEVVCNIMFVFFLLLMFHFWYYKNTNLYKHFKVAKQVWRELPNAWKQRFSTPLHFTVELHWVEPGSHEKHFRLFSVWSAGTEIGKKDKIFFKNRKHYNDSDLTVQVKKMAGLRHYYLACFLVI